MAKAMIRLVFTLVLLGFTATAVQAVPLPLKPTSDGWLAFGGLPQGCNGWVSATAVGPNGELYVGGTFSLCGGTPVQNIARYENGLWSALGVGIGVTGAYDSIEALALSGSTLYVGGYFSHAGGHTAHSIAQWDINTATWAPLVDRNNQVDGVDGSVLALTVSGTTLYVGGEFTQAGGQTAQYIAQWDSNTNTWAPLVDQGSLVNGVDNVVEAIAVSAGTLYVGGQFTQAGDQTAHYIAQWDSNTNTWAPLVDQGSQSNGVDSDVYALVVSAGMLYVGGGFTQAGGQAAQYIAQWNSNLGRWAPLVDQGTLVNGVDSGVRALTVSAGTLYVGGGFTQAGGQTVKYIAQWNSNTWAPLVDQNSPVNGVDRNVSVLTVSAGTLYVGGYFTQAGGQPANRIAGWDTGTSTWFGLGSGSANGLNSAGGALATSATGFYAGGGFTQAGGQTANGIVQWNSNTSTWAPLINQNGQVNGVDNSVYALALSGNTLYAGGYFSQAGGQTANGIAQWNPGSSTWTTLSSGVNAFGSVFALAISGTTLYAGGNFSQAGGQVANRVAQWNTGSSIWAALNDGTTNGFATNSYVAALAYNSAKDRLAIGGSFLASGATTTSCLALWSKTGNTWILLQPTAVLAEACHVSALAWMDGDLYVGGGGLAASDTDPDNYLVRLSISDSFTVRRSPVGRGVNGPVYALATDANQKRLYVTGDFNQVGGHVSSNIAIAETDVIFRNSFETP